MDDEADDVSEWKKLKKTLTVNKPLIPLKLTMLLYYGGNLMVRFNEWFPFNDSDDIVQIFSLLSLPPLLDPANATSRAQH